MKEQDPLLRPELRERDPDRVFQVSVIGAACSGKSTLLRAMRDDGYTVRPEPENPVFELFIENPKKYAYRNQLHKTTQLMEQEVLETRDESLSDPHFRESGVLATDIYNRYLFDQGYMSAEQFAHLNWLYEHHLASFPTPDLVVYLYATDDVIKTRAVKQDGLVAHDPHALTPYWDKLLTKLEQRGIPVVRINTGTHPVTETKQLILSEISRLKQETDAQRRPAEHLRFRDVPSFGKPGGA